MFSEEKLLVRPKNPAKNWYKIFLLKHIIRVCNMEKYVSKQDD